MDSQLEPEPERFHDGGLPGGSPDLSSPPTIVLRRTPDDPLHEFHMPRRIGYLDRRLGDLLVPDDPDEFATDFASIPRVLAWLVPRTGPMLPAAILHDGLVGRPDQPASYISVEGHEIGWEEANRVFRDAMADAGTPLLRRWLLWTGVTLAAMVVGRGTEWSTAERWRWRITAVATLAMIAVLGVLATFDLFDVAVPVVGGVPWMGERPWWQELLTGATGAVVVPVVLGLLWGRFRAAGMIAGTSLALLLHVSAAVALLSGLYRVLERLVTRGDVEV